MISQKYETGRKVRTWLWRKSYHLQFLTVVLGIAMAFILGYGFGRLSLFPEKAKVISLKQQPTLRNNVQILRSGIDQWQQINTADKKTKTTVYSAYWDNRTNPACIRIIGSTLLLNGPAVNCEVLLPSGENLIIPAVKKAINEHFDRHFSSFIFSCCTSKYANVAPEWVSVFEENLVNISAKLRVHHNGKERFTFGNFALCVKPFFNDYNDAVSLIEFIEYYRMQGVEHFLFYNYSVGPGVQRVLKKYEDENLATVLPWGISIVSPEEIFTMNQFSALNDCPFRLMDLYKYVVSLDVDEFIVPRNNTTIENLLVDLSAQNDGTCVASYVFRNAFFFKDWENDISLFGVEPKSPPRYLPYLLTQYKTRREKMITKRWVRSKYIMEPLNVLEAGNHFTWRHIGDCRDVEVPPDVALSQHYRACVDGGKGCLKSPSVVDRTAHRFGMELMNRVLESCQSFVLTTMAGECNF